jgi:hypothetical protein
MGDVNSMRNLAFTLAVLTMGACVVDDQPDESETQSDVLSTNKLAANKLAANKLAANKLAANKLSASALPSNTTLVDSADGREVLSYVVGCALTAAQSVQVRATGGTVYTFSGQIGLAPSWATSAPTLTDRHWVTACVLSRVNLYGVSVQLSMRGATSALNTTAAEGAYTMDEGAFYGDLFDPNGPTEYACKSHITWNASTTSAQNRQCAETTDGVTTKCGFTYTGVCQTNSECTKSTLNFASCHTAQNAGGSVIAEVITIFLQPN